MGMGMYYPSPQPGGVGEAQADMWLLECPGVFLALPSIDLPNGAWGLGKNSGCRHGAEPWIQAVCSVTGHCSGFFIVF